MFGLARLNDSGLRSFLLDHIDATAVAIENNNAISQGEQGVVATNADIAARVIAGAALTNQNVAGENRGAAVGFDAEPLAAGIAAVLD